MKGLLLLLLLVLAVSAKRQFTLETNTGDGEWTVRGTLTVAKSKRLSQPTVKFEANELEGFEKKLASASMWHYRVVDEATGAVSASLLASPCTIIRGFETPSTEKLILPETVGVVVDSSEDIVGLRLQGATNLHHTTTAAASCDLRVLTMFRNVMLNLRVVTAKPTAPRSVSDFQDGVGGVTAPQPQKVKDDDKTTDDKTPEVDNRSFLERNWLYIVMIGVWMLVNGFVGATAQKKK